MLIKFYTVACLTLGFQIAFSQGGYWRIPIAIRDTLDREYPGWKLEDNLRLLQSPELRHEHYDTTISLPNLVWADFDENNSLDYALFLTRTLSTGDIEHRLVVFLARASGFQPYILKSVVEPVYFANYIWLAKKGSKSTFANAQEDVDNTWILESDGIDLITIGKYSEVILFKNRQFHVVVTSD
jgi:hypothetical protein